MNFHVILLHVRVFFGWIPQFHLLLVSLCRFLPYFVHHSPKNANGQWANYDDMIVLGNCTQYPH